MNRMTETHLQIMSKLKLVYGIRLVYLIIASIVTYGQFRTVKRRLKS